MKKVLTYCLIILWGYLCGSFIAWSFNPSDWDSGGRYVLVMFTSFACAIYKFFFSHGKFI